MAKDPQEVILCVLEKIKYQADITPEIHQKEIGLRGSLRHLEYPFGKPIVGKIIILTRQDATGCNISFGYELGNILGKLKKDKVITDFRFVDDEMGGYHSYYEIALPKDFDKRFQEIKEDLDKKLKERAEIRAEEMRRQFEELGAKQEEREELKQEILEEIKEKPVNQMPDNIETMPIREPFPIRIVGETEIKIKSAEDENHLQKMGKIKLKSQTIEFNDDEAIIKIGKQNVALPAYKNEHYFCQAVFEYKPKEPISWDIIFDKMTGHSTISGGKKPEPIRKNWQKVNDTMKRVNNRIKEVINTDDDLFSWSEKNVIRSY